MLNDTIEIIFTILLLIIFLFIDLKLLRKDGSYAYGMGKVKMGEVLTAIYIIYLIYKYVENYFL